MVRKAVCNTCSLTVGAPFDPRRGLPTKARMLLAKTYDSPGTRRTLSLTVDGMLAYFLAMRFLRKSVMVRSRTCNGGMMNGNRKPYTSSFEYADSLVYSVRNKRFSPRTMAMGYPQPHLVRAVFLVKLVRIVRRRQTANAA